MYNSPIELLITDIQNQIMKQQDEEIYQAVLHYVPNVDREELIRALQYDRNQYEKGYADGKRDALPKWIPVTERLPDVAITHKNRWEHSTESVHVLCACLQKSGKRMVKEGSCKVYASGTIYWMIPGTVDSVTHWMPLPEAPKEVE